MPLKACKPHLRVVAAASTTTAAYAALQKTVKV
jgi:hypothetical protein